MEHKELFAKFERGEITVDEYMVADTSDAEPFKVERARRNGRKQAERVLAPAVSPTGRLDAFQPPPMQNVKPDREFKPLFDGNPEPRALTSTAQALKFILAGNAYFTLRSKATGARYTYRVNKPDPQPGKCKYCLNDPCRCVPRYFVSLLTGPENTSDYTYLGMLTNKRFTLTRASKMPITAKPVAAISLVMTRLFAGTMLSQLEIWHEGRCGRCGRTLTVPESIALGLGPECAGKV